MVAWPSTLPPAPLIDGWDEEFPTLTVRTQMDAGPDKVRRRFTAGVRPMTWPMLLTTAQLTALDTFYFTTLAGGAFIFTHVHPRTGGAISLRIKKAPKYSSVSHLLFKVTLELEIMP